MVRYSRVPLLVPLLLWMAAAPADDGETLSARLEGLDSESDLEQVMLALGRGGPLDLDRKAIAAVMDEHDCHAPTPLLQDATRLEVRRYQEPVRVEARVLREAALETRAPWRGAGERRLRLATAVLWRIVDGRVVKVEGVTDLGPVPAEVELPAPELESDGFVALLGGRRRGGPSAEAALDPPPWEVATAVFEATTNAGRKNQMKTGTLTVNGSRYTFRSGGYGNGNLPPGQYTATAHRWSRSERGYSVDGVGWTVALEDKYDERVGATRTLLRIHPDGNRPGTEGCIGIVGGAATQTACREDLRAALQRGGGSFTLMVR